MMFFEYVPENTFFHRIHPLSKIIYVIAFILVAWVNVWATIFILLTSFFSFYISKAWKQDSGLLKLIVTTFTLLFLANWFLYSIAYPSKIWLVDKVFSAEGLYLSFLLSSRILIIILNIILFFSTTTPEELEDFLLSIHLPSSLIISFTLTITFIPLVANEIRRIHQSQLLRGLARTKLFSKITSYVSSMILPLMISILNRANRIAEVLEIYGVPPENRTILTRLIFSSRDALLISITIIICMTLYYLGIILPTQLIKLSPFV